MQAPATTPSRLDNAVSAHAQRTRNKRRNTIAAALLGSVLVHALTVTAVQWGDKLGLLSDTARRALASDSVFEARLLPSEAPTAAPVPPPPNKPLLAAEPAPKPIKERTKPAPKKAKAAVPLVPLKDLVLPPKPVMTTPADAAPVAEPLLTANALNPISEVPISSATDPLASTPPIEPSADAVAAPEQLAEQTVPPPDVSTVLPVLDTIQSPPSSLPPINSNTMRYELPKNVTVQYDLTVRKSGLSASGKAVLTFKKTDASLNADGTPNERLPSSISSGYAAELRASANVLFKNYEAIYSSAGYLTAYGLRPLRIEETRPKKSMIATTVEPDFGRFTISSQEGFFPYNPNTVDFLGMVMQLGINQQVEARWRVAGTVQDFKIYRPKGVTEWRLQSQGTQTIPVMQNNIEALYIKRIPLDDAPDNDDMQHLWLDPARYGFPVRIYWEQKDGTSFDIVMRSWQEQ
jgi:hypothetical protein